MAGSTSVQVSCQLGGGLDTRLPYSQHPDGSVRETLSAESLFFSSPLFETFRMWVQTLSSSPRQENPSPDLWHGRSNSSVDNEDVLPVYLFLPSLCDHRGRANTARGCQSSSAVGRRSTFIGGFLSRVSLSCSKASIQLYLVEWCPIQGNLCSI